MSVVYVWIKRLKSFWHVFTASVKLVLTDGKINFNCKENIVSDIIDISLIVIYALKANLEYFIIVINTLVLDFQKKMLAPAGPQVFIFVRQNKLVF